MSKLKSVLSIFNLNSKKKRVTAVALSAAILAGSNLAYQESTKTGTFQTLERIETIGSQVCAVELSKTTLIAEVPISKSNTVDAATKRRVAADLRGSRDRHFGGGGPYDQEEPTVMEETVQESILSSKCSTDIDYVYHTKYRGAITNNNSILQLKFNSKEIDKIMWEKGSFSYKLYKPFPWSKEFNILSASESKYQSHANKNYKTRYQVKENDATKIFGK